MSRVLILCPDRVGAEMAGVGIRHTEMARVLAREHQVTLAAPAHGGEQAGLPYRLVRYVDGTAAVRRLIDGHDVVVVQAFSSLAVTAAQLTAGRQALVVDLYCPYFFENALGGVDGLDAARRQHRLDISVLQEQLWSGDFFLCANERQRDLLIGMLAGRGRLTPDVLARDPSLERMVAVVPSGVAVQEPLGEGPPVQALVPGAGTNDKVIVWGGGIYEWLDPLTPVRAMRLVQERRGDVKLLFATNRGAHGGPPGGTGRRAFALASENGTLGRSVFFHDGWFPYEARGSYLRGATAGLVSHPSHVETRYAFRTRVLEYLWAGLPLVVTEGDTFAELTAARGLGSVVPAEEPAALAETVLGLVDDEARAAGCRQRVAEVRRELAWERTVAPLVAYCGRPQLTRSLADPELVRIGSAPLYPRPTPLHLARRVMHYLRRYGVKETRVRVEAYVGRRLAWRGRA